MLFEGMHVVYHGYMIYMGIKTNGSRDGGHMYPQSGERGNSGRQTDRHIDTEIKGERQTERGREREKRWHSVP